jgi:hypothetical protein
MKIHAVLVSRGAYKQIIGALIDSEKYMKYTSVKCKSVIRAEI